MVKRDGRSIAGRDPERKAKALARPRPGTYAFKERPSHAASARLSLHEHANQQRRSGRRIFLAATAPARQAHPAAVLFGNHGCDIDAGSAFGGPLMPNSLRKRF